ncbi:MAG: rplA [Candidatus Saccharibacteria bacterium]|nr:rplA [Candidatus Saccharibacteria bacterium]
MAKKADLLERAKELGLKVTANNTIAEIEAAINTAGAVNVEAEIVKEEKAEVTVAKAGKRSAKSLREAEEEVEKEARKAVGDTAPQSEDAEQTTVTKGPRPVTRPLVERRGKGYREAAAKVDATKHYTLTEAAALAAETSPSKFDASVEVHVRLGVDPRQADQNVRATVSLPHGTGKTIRVAVFAPEADHAAATSAGADIVGDEELLKQLDKEDLNFDILVATPQYMPRLGKYARLLGPRGLMPNPKSGSVATDVAKAVKDAKAGRVEYRVDKQAIVHLAIGKVSFGAKKIEENARVFFDSLIAQKPASVKSVYIKSISISTTQGPGIKLENNIG